MRWEIRRSFVIAAVVVLGVALGAWLARARPVPKPAAVAAKRPASSTPASRPASPVEPSATDPRIDIAAAEIGHWNAARLKCHPGVDAGCRDRAQLVTRLAVHGSAGDAEWVLFVDSTDERSPQLYSLVMFDSPAATRPRWRAYGFAETPGHANLAAAEFLAIDGHPPLVSFDFSEYHQGAGSEMRSLWAPVGDRMLPVLEEGLSFTGESEEDRDSWRGTLTLGQPAVGVDLPDVVVHRQGLLHGRTLDESIRWRWDGRRYGADRRGASAPVMLPGATIPTATGAAVSAP